MNILFLSSEVVPFAKTGGLADVAGALPIALEKLGHRVMVCMPKYRQAAAYPDDTVLGKGVNVHLIANDELYDRYGIYVDEAGLDYPDNVRRFSYYCRASLELVKKKNFRPDIIHCNDWQTGLVPVYLKELYKNDNFFKHTKTVFTIHNLAYTGSFDFNKWQETGLRSSLFSIDGLEYYGRFSLLKAGLVFSDAITAVSPTYAKEIQDKEYGCGMEGILKSRASGLYGVLNGIDYDLWNPLTDRHIYKNYSYENMDSKYANKEQLVKELGMDMDLKKPLVGSVGRLAYQKGYDLLSEIVPKMSEMGIGFVLLGTGEQRYHDIFSEIAKKYKRSVSINLTFDAALAQKIYAASDIFLMPSRYEPCGLGQLISFKYSTVPLVRKTGGLADTVSEYDLLTERGNGFVFSEPEPEKLFQALSRAVRVYEDREKWRRLITKIAQYDFSWDKSASEYEKIYKNLACNA
jgi:starch synthase